MIVYWLIFNFGILFNYHTINEKYINNSGVAYGPQRHAAMGLPDEWFEKYLDLIRKVGRLGYHPDISI